MPSIIGLFLAVTVAVIAIIFGLLQASHGEVPFNPPQYMQQYQDTPLKLHDGLDYTFGRFRSPVSEPNFRELNLFESTFQRKEWFFSAVTDNRFLLGFAAVDLGYVETGFLYFFDTRTGSHDHWQFILPGFVNAAKIAPSDVMDGACSNFTTYYSALHVDICFNAQLNGWRVNARGKTKRNCKISLQVDMVRNGGDEFAMNYPIGLERAGYTHKTAGLAVNGTLTLLPPNRMKAEHVENKMRMNEPFDGVGLTDYTRSQSRRYTEWFWMALAFSRRNKDTGEVARAGFQLSTNTVGTLESIVWLDSMMFPIESPLTVSFVNTSTNQSTVLKPGDLEIIPSRSTRYDITSADGNVNLEYYPRGVVPNKVRTPLVYGGFYHSYGIYRGSVTVNFGTGNKQVKLSMKKRAGIFEDHSVHW